jgi:hypothetical protein
VAYLTKATLTTMDREVMNHPSYSPDLVPSDVHLFGPLKVRLGGQIFQTDDELKCGVLN